MVFSGLFFLLFFLPLNLAAYYLAKDLKTKNKIMLIFSLIFYAWGEPVYILLLVGMALADWYFMLLLSASQSAARKKFWLFSAIATDLLLLGIFKYAGFILSNCHLLFGFPDSIPSILLPIGISFYTFQLITYCVDVYRGIVPAQRQFSLLLLYVSMFHQCIAGPIVRYRDISKELTDRTVTYADISEGINRFIAGLAKKAILANTCAKVVSNLLLEENGSFPSLHSRSVLALWIAAIVFMLQIYLDFSAYSDMAIGMGRMIGIHYPENFKYPYLSRSVTEFWRRWHITLGRFFRDYLYIPMGGNRKGVVRTVLNLFVVWFLTGLWHGASWNFVLWGLYYFLFLMLEKFLIGKYLRKNKIVSHCYLLFVVFIGWILFQFVNLSDIGTFFKGMIGCNGNAFADFETWITLKNHMTILLICILACTPIASYFHQLLQFTASRNTAAFLLHAVLQFVIPAALLLLSIAALITNTYNPFLYFRF